MRMRDARKPVHAARTGQARSIRGDRCRRKECEPNPFFGRVSAACPRRCRRAASPASRTTTAASTRCACAAPDASSGDSRPGDRANRSFRLRMRLLRVRRAARPSTGFARPGLLGIVRPAALAPSGVMVRAFPCAAPLGPRPYRGPAFRPPMTTGSHPEASASRMRSPRGRNGRAPDRRRSPGHRPCLRKPAIGARKMRKAVAYATLFECQSHASPIRPLPSRPQARGAARASPPALAHDGRAHERGGTAQRRRALLR